MEQLRLPLEPYRREYRPLKGPICPCCKQNAPDDRARLAVWQSFRDWLVQNWDWAALELLRMMALAPAQGGPDGLSLTAHPDLLWALMADAGAHGLELSDRLAEILDGFFQGEFDELKRRGKRLRLPDPAKPVCKFCAGDMHQDLDGVWRCESDRLHSFWVNSSLPPGLQGVWMGRNRCDFRNGAGPLPAWLPEIA